MAYEMRTFLITATSFEHIVCNDHYTVPPPDVDLQFGEVAGSAHVRRSNDYISNIITHQLGPQLFTYEENLGTLRDMFDELRPAGLIVPVGHGDINTLLGMGFRNAAVVGVPVFEAHKHYPGYRGYEGKAPPRLEDMTSRQRERQVEKAFEEWVSINFRSLARPR